MNDSRVLFQFKGSRQYIQGPDIFNAMTGGYPAETLSNIRFSAHGLVLTPECRLFRADTPDELYPLQDVRARCQFDAGGITRWLALTSGDGDATSGDRYEYDEGLVISRCRIEGDVISLTQQAPFSFIENIVAMDKHLHQQLFPNAVGKWLFTRIDMTVGCDAREDLSIRLRHNMNYQLTKSDILVKGQKTGDLFFSLVRT